MKVSKEWSKDWMEKNAAKQEGRGYVYDDGSDLRKKKEEEVESDRGKELRNHDDGGFVSVDSKRYVSFYFTNFPPLLPKFFLRKGFEVCGMLEDVFVAKKTNRFGEPYGFVKFSNVKDIAKMTKALNAVWFGYYRVSASVALFNRLNKEEVSRPVKEMVGKVKGVVKPMTKDGHKISPQIALPKDGTVGSSEPLSTLEKDGAGISDGVRVGEIVVKLGAKKERGAREEARKTRGGMKPFEVKQHLEVAQEKECKVLMRKYQSRPDDVEWVQKGLVAMLLNGEAITVVQNRLFDAGFGDMVITPMGADKVFIRSLEGVDVLPIVNGAKEFFKLIFSHWLRWDQDAIPYRRGAWVRLYGVPLHAWNVDFFKLCVFECGSFLRLDSCSKDKVRMDFARVLIATPDLDTIKRIETVLVDGVQVEVKIVEEWGYDLGEDACLLEEESESDSQHSENGEGLADPEACDNFDVLVERFSEGLEKDVCDVFPNQDADVLLEKIEDNQVVEKVVEEEDLRVIDSTQKVEHQKNNSSSKEVKVSGSAVGILSRCKRTNSCPPKASRSIISGPWSLEWLHDHNHGDAGVIFSACKRGRTGVYHGERQHMCRQSDPRKSKDGGPLRHPLHSIKKVARMPCKDRKEILKVLKKNVRRRRGGDGVNRSCSVRRRVPSNESSSSASVNNDWQNWVAMQGTEQMAVDDVWGIGKAIGVKFKGDNVNMFHVLSRAGKGKKESLRSREGGEARHESVC
ncbi:putative sulfate transporter [Trifolium pratense]|uniref:Putative sulfate transporter n=1 Tax=Trifolium pratense TaxID=57577 RepID=A0A2K3N584_TRIPR|nr:putative sulfate transporter [Trifolium pratense]